MTLSCEEDGPSLFLVPHDEVPIVLLAELSTCEMGLLRASSLNTKCLAALLGTLSCSLGQGLAQSLPRILTTFLLALISNQWEGILRTCRYPDLQEN